MGIHLYFSNQLSPLADRLHANLEAGAENAFTFAPTVVIVPNMNLAKWIKLTLARKTGILMNVEFRYLEAGLWRMLTQLSPHDRSTVELLDNERLKMLIYFALQAPAEDAGDREPFDRYLNLSDGQGRPDAQLRCWQLAGELARLFQAYMHHRADMIEGWLAPKDNPSPADAMERAQRWLYRRVMNLKHVQWQRTGLHLMTAGELSKALVDGRCNEPDEIRCHIFGVSQISPLNVHLLGELQAFFDIHIYSLNPSREYWEDIRSPAEKKWMRRKGTRSLKLDPDELDSGNLFSEPDHPLLSAWGKPGRESIRLLCQLTDYNFHAGFDEPPAPSSVLAAIRRGLLTLEPPGGGAPAMDQDTSLQIMACPGIHREVEQVYFSILHNLEIDPTLCMTDIAVMVTDMARYKPVVDTVFNRQPARISYNLVDARAQTESLFAQAVMALMAIVQGHFSRKAVFDLLRNPLVMQRWNYGPDEVAVWVAWADALGIFHDLEQPPGDTPDGPAAGCYTWRQGLERLRLSRIMALPSSQAEGPHPHFEGIVPFADIHSGDERVLETLGQIIHALGEAVDVFHLQEATATAWRDAFFEMVNRFVVVTGDHRGEETVYRSLIEAFDGFTDYDILMQGTAGRPLSADSMWAFVRTHLEGITGGQGDYLTGGVTVSALMPMRPIPFKIVYVLGLEEGRFPGRTPESMLDLRRRQRRIGDISLAEQNRYLFLEILISVTDKLYLGYVNRDLQKDRRLAPCSVVQQLIRYVENHILRDRRFIRCKVPYRGDSADYLAPDRVKTWSDVLAVGSTVGRLSGLRRGGMWDDFTCRAGPADMLRTARFLPDLKLVAAGAEEGRDGPPSLELPVRLLRHFLIDPVAVMGMYHLGTTAADVETLVLAEIEDEPVASQFPEDYRLRLEPLRGWVAGQMGRDTAVVSLDELEQRFDAHYSDRCRKSRVPIGAFGEHDRRRLKASVLAVGEIVAPFIEQMRASRQCYAAVRMGSPIDAPASGGGRVLALDPACIAAADSPDASPLPLPGPAVVEGSLPWVWQGADDTWHCLVLTGSAKNARYPDKYVVGPVLTLAALCAGGIACPWSNQHRMVLHLVYQGHVLNLAYHFDLKAARGWLGDLIAGLLEPPPFEWLPYEIVMGDAVLRRTITGGDEPALDHALFQERMTALMAETADLTAEMVGARVTEESLHLARIRLAPFFPVAMSVGSAPLKMPSLDANPR